MEKEITMYTIECDLCKTQFVDEHEGFVAWADYDGARDNALDSEWTENVEQGKKDKHYCPECYSINDNDEVVNKKTGEFLCDN
tara:strand:+ start:149 stop:397 length:249 start_codon:yes stop_codon:yes gene_type:complete